MGLFKRSSRAKRVAMEQQVSFDDADGVLVNVMVVSALILSFSVGVFGSIPEEELVLADFRRSMVPSRDSPDLQALRKEYVGILEEEGFNFTKVVRMSSPEVLDVREVLLREYSGSPWIDADAYRDLNLAYHFIKDTMKERYFTSAMGVVSNAIGRMYGISVMLETLALLTSLFFYMALMLSCVREEMDLGHDQSLLAFMKILKPIMVGMIVEVIGGLVCFFWGLVELCRVRFPDWAVSVHFMIVYMFSLLIPLGLLGGALAGAAWVIAQRAGNQRAAVQRQHLEEYGETPLGMFLTSIGMEEHLGGFGKAKMDEETLKMASVDHLVSLFGLPLGDALRIWRAAQNAV